MALDNGFAWGRPNVGSLSQFEGRNAQVGTGAAFLACTQWAKDP